jgi:hypothetical protein
LIPIRGLKSNIDFLILLTCQVIIPFYHPIWPCMVCVLKKGATHNYSSRISTVGIGPTFGKFLSQNFQQKVVLCAKNSNNNNNNNFLKTLDVFRMGGDDINFDVEILLQRNITKSHSKSNNIFLSVYCLKSCDQSMNIVIME